MFRSAIVKLTARCNLSCTYCYMFNLADRTYAAVPALMAADTAVACLDRIAEHCRSQSVPDFNVVLHGGEPTLWPRRSFEALFRHADELRRGGIDINFALQTNGLRFDPWLLDLLAEHHCSIGISLDGPEFINDRFRVTRSGRGSYARITATVQELLGSGYGGLLGGFLAVAQPDVAPSEFLDWAAKLPGKRLDVLWPMHYNYEHPPWGDGNVAEYARAPRYGTWFATLFAEWFRRDDPEMYIRSFYDLIGVILGSRKHGDAIVNDVLDMFVVNTDGGIEYHDYFRPIVDGGTRTPFNVARDSLDTAATDDIFDFALHLGAHRPQECEGCPELAVCGGGFLPGRLETGRRIPKRKSVMCYDQFHYFQAARALVSTHSRDTRSLKQRSA